MISLAERIVAIAQVRPEGALLSAKDFLHLDARPAITRALCRLVREGRLLRLSRGVYAAPVHGRFGAMPPSTQAVLQALEAAGEIVVPHGATAANTLGLTTQVPIREVFLTSGASRTLYLGERPVELRHASRRQLLLGNRPAGQVLRALLWLGPNAASSATELLLLGLPALSGRHCATRGPGFQAGWPRSLVRSERSIQSPLPRSARRGTSTFDDESWAKL